MHGKYRLTEGNLPLFAQSKLAEIALKDALNLDSALGEVAGK